MAHALGVPLGSLIDQLCHGHRPLQAELLLVVVAVLVCGAFGWFTAARGRRALPRLLCVLRADLQQGAQEVRRADAPAQGYPPPQNYPPAQGYPPLGPAYPNQYQVRSQDQQLMSGAYDGPAIAAFVLGIIAIVPLAIGFAIAGLRNTRGGLRRGRWMAVTALVLSAAWVSLFGVLVAVSHGHEAHRTASGTVSKAGTMSAFAIRVGDCVRLPEQLDSINNLTVVPCTELHNAQAFAVRTLQESSYPGETQTRASALAACRSAEPAFLGPGATALHIVALFPSRLRWASGDRNAHCLLVDRVKDITGDIRADK